MGRLDTVQWGADRLRVGPWRGDADVAYIAPIPGQPPSAGAVVECLRLLGDRGFRSVITAALSPAEQEAFLREGFTVHEHLHLLRHPLETPIGHPALATRRGRRRDRAQVLDVDHRAFSPFWRFDQAGLDDARQATPTSRYRVIGRDGRVDGYAVTGRAGPVSYLQRLAVHPDHQGHGLGTSLTTDALHWAQRRGAHSMLVNTQERNVAARTLYEGLGFVLEHHGLDVLERLLPAGEPDT
jgi:ribosomal protein S18 acetylase RimI-like enzyme